MARMYYGTDKLYSKAFYTSLHLRLLNAFLTSKVASSSTGSEKWLPLCVTMVASVTFLKAPIIDRPGRKPHSNSSNKPWLQKPLETYPACTVACTRMGPPDCPVTCLLRPEVISSIFCGKYNPVFGWQFPALLQAGCHRAPVFYRVLVRLQLLSIPLWKMVKIPYSVVVRSRIHE